MMKAGRIGTLVFWFAVIAALAGLFPAQPGNFLIKVGAVILLAHVVEVVLMYTLLREQARPEPKDIPLVLVYGAFHLQPKLKANQK